MEFGSFGVAASNLNAYALDHLLILKPDFVQVPLHLIKLPASLPPSLNIIGKFISKRPLPHAFYQDLFQRYKEQILCWDFGGEPETMHSEKGNRWEGSSKEFSEEIKKIYSIGKAVNPENTIGCGGFISATFNGFFGNEDRSPFLRELLEQGILSFMDFCSINLFRYGYGGQKHVFAGIHSRFCQAPPS